MSDDLSQLSLNLFELSSPEEGGEKEFWEICENYGCYEFDTHVISYYDIIV